MLKQFYILFFLFFLAGFIGQVTAQNDAIRRIRGAGSRLGNSGGAIGQGDSIIHRTGLEDSITIRFRYLDSSRYSGFDSSIKDFTTRFPVPWHHVHLGNLGNATSDLIFSPLLKAGWDPGLHAYDVYAFNIQETRFFTTTRPYSEVGYLLGSKSEQLIHLLHTQNIRPNWNASIQYRLINSPGFFQNQNTNHNNYRLGSFYQSRNKRYHNFLVIVGNKLQSAENGGIRQDANYLDSNAFSDDRFKIPTQIGFVEDRGRNFFSSTINTGTKLTTGSFLLRQQYDLGQKDSIVTDSTVVPLFYPRLRLEHTIQYNTFKYRFEDLQSDNVETYARDSAYYENNYSIQLSRSQRKVIRRDYWKDMVNDFSIYQFPDAKNPLQFFKVGAALQNLKGDFDTGLIKKSYYNFFIHGEYRNKTRNQKWDIEARGNFFVNGLNAGDYEAFISLKRLISARVGYLSLGFQNVNRTPSFTFNPVSNFYLDVPKDLNKENTIHIFGTLEQPRQRLRLTVGYMLISNYSYFRNYFEVDQVSSLFNLLRITAEKQFRISKNWNLKTQLVLQQKAGSSPVNMPLLFTRNQVGYDGNLGFKNLLVSMGLEFRYFTPFYANGFSPLTGQFFIQESQKTTLKSPEIHAYVHFRIKSFTAYLRAENLNSLDITNGGFTNNNVIIPAYPYPGLQIRLGIFWSFVN